MKPLYKTALTLLAAAGALLLSSSAFADQTRLMVDGELLRAGPSPTAVAPSAPLYSNLVTDAGSALMNGGVNASGTRYTSLVCNRLELSEPGPQQITNFTVVLRNNNAAAFTPTSASVLFYDDSGANGGPGTRLLNKASIYYGGGNFATGAMPAQSNVLLRSATAGYTAAYVPAPTASYQSKVWACVMYTAPSGQAAALANVGLEKFANTPTVGSTTDLAFVSTIGVSSPGNNPPGTLSAGTGDANVFGWELTTLGDTTLLDSYQVKNAGGTVGTAGFTVNPSTGVEKNFSGYAALVDAPPLAAGMWNVTGLVLYPSCAVANYTEVQATIQFWDTFNGSAAPDVFGNSTPIASQTVDLGAFNCASGTSVYQFPVLLPTPISLGHTGTFGITVKYSADSGAGLVDGVFMEVIQNAPAASPLIAVGGNASTGGTGWYKSASDRADLNFDGAIDYVTGTRQHTALRVFANMVAPTHVVTASTSGPGTGTVSPSGASNVFEGATVAYTLTPDAGNHVVTVLGSCGGTLSGSTFVTAPITTDCTVNAVFAAGVGTNGLYQSPTMNHALMDNGDGSSLNLVTGAWDDTGPLGAAWDINFWSSGGALRFYRINGLELVVSAANVAVLNPGDVIGQSSTFGTGGTPVAGWLAGADAYFGYRFNCNGRLANPVAGVCYGYAHLTTTGPSGFPATLVDYVYDGDGNPVTVGTLVRTVTSSVGTGSGLIDPLGTRTTIDGGTITYTLIPDAGYHADTIDGTCPIGTLAGNSYTTGAVTADCTVIANFAADIVTHVVTPSVGTGDGTISPNADQTVNDGDTVAFTLTADSGFHIDSVGGTCGGSLADNEFTTAAVTNDCTVIANFAADNPDLVCAAPNHNMVATFDGSSINWITGVIDDVGGQDGWNPYASSSNVSFYWPSAGGGGGVATGNVYSVLAPGAMVGPSSTFIALTATSATADWRAGADGYMGFKLTCPGAGTCYGYAHLTSTAATGFPLTLVDYCYDSAGAQIIIPGGAATHTVTPSVGTPSGTITPATDQTVNNGDTIDFTLAADAGFEIDNVGGSCGGTLDSVSGIFTTALVTADCTVIANFAAIPPRIDVIPASLAASQGADQTSTHILTIANVGSGTLNWNIDEENTVAPRVVAPFRLAPPAPVVTSSSDCPQYETYAGREPDGWAEFCGTPAQASPGLVNRAPADTAFALDVRNKGFVQFALNNFSGQTLLGSQPDSMYGMDFDPTATTLYALNDATGELGTINLTTGAFTGIVTCTVPGGGSWSGLSIDPVSGTFYASTATDLYVLNPATCSPTLIGAFGTGGGMIDIAVNTAGQMYGHDIGTDSIYSINPATGAASLVGPTGYAANFAQGMDFDNNDGTLYIFVYTGSGTNTFGTVNLATGAVTPLAQNSPLGEFEGATQTAGTAPPCSVSLDIPWLSLDTLAGSNAGGTWTDVTVTFDSTGYGVGVYTGNLCVSSNDTTQPLVTVPVSMTVEAPPSTAIFCSSFEEGEDGTCATAP